MWLWALARTDTPQGCPENQDLEGILQGHPRQDRSGRVWQPGRSWVRAVGTAFPSCQNDSLGEQVSPAGVKFPFFLSYEHLGWAVSKPSLFSRSLRRKRKSKDTWRNCPGVEAEEGLLPFRQTPSRCTRVGARSPLKLRGMRHIRDPSPLVSEEVTSSPHLPRHLWEAFYHCCPLLALSETAPGPTPVCSSHIPPESSVRKSSV